MTTDDLTERIEVSTRKVMRRSALIADVDLPAYLAAAVLPIVEAERRDAKAEALREAAEVHEAEGLDVNTESMPHHDGGGYVTVSQWLRARAAEHETRRQR